LNARKTENKQRLAWLDGIRALLALYVVLYHGFQNIDPGLPSGPTVWWVRYGFAHARLAVAAFIVVSGFSLMLPVAKRGGRASRTALRFYAARYWRILPPYYLALALSIAIVGIRSVRPDDFLAHILLVQQFYHPFAINPPLWSVAVECAIYILFPLLVVAFARIGALATILITTAVVTPFYFQFSPPSEKNMVYPAFLVLFEIGMVGAVLLHSADRRAAALRRALAGPAFALLLPIAAYLTIRMIGYGPGYILEGPMSAVFAVCVIAVFLHCAGGGLLGRLFGLRPLAWVGTFAFSLYLIHAPLVSLFFAAASRKHVGIFLAAGLPLIVAAAFAFFTLCERPFLKRFWEKTGPQAGPAAEPTPPADKDLAVVRS
jgi:peptidoglycan/LPS O-acetylase OafA/YrhL